MTDVLHVRAYGTPAPQGSKRLFVVAGRAVATEASPHHKAWREAVKEATLLMAERPLQGPVAAALVFHLARPKTRPRKRVWPDSRPDLDKLLRATLDGLKDGGAYEDDSQVCWQTTLKQYADPPTLPGASIVVWTLTAEDVGPLMSVARKLTEGEA